MNKLYIFGKTLFFLIILFLLVNIFDFVGTTQIKVVDLVTNKPLSNIRLAQNITGEVSMGPGGSDSYPIRILEKTTNSEGVATFPVKLHIHAPLTRWFNEETVSANQHIEDLDFNNGYYSGYVDFGIKHLLPYKTKTIKLTPYVDEISDCGNNSDCEFSNALYLAFTKDDESYCKKLQTDTTNRYDGGAFLRGECYSIIALSKQDRSLCENVPESAYRGKKQCLNYTDEEGEWGQEVCDQFYYMDNRTFLACYNLLEKYGCKGAPEKCEKYYEYFDSNTRERIN